VRSLLFCYLNSMLDALQISLDVEQADLIRRIKTVRRKCPVSQTMPVGRS
jgi:hypothetical protein